MLMLASLVVVQILSLELAGLPLHLHHRLCHCRRRHKFELTANEIVTASVIKRCPRGGCRPRRGRGAGWAFARSATEESQVSCPRPIPGQVLVLALSSSSSIRHSIPKTHLYALCHPRPRPERN